MSLIKALERKACPVTKKIMWSISLKPSQWPFLWLLTVTFPHRIIPGTSPLMSLDWKKSYRVVQEPWVPWYRFFVGCVGWFVFLWVLHCSAKVPENRAVKKKKEMVAHLSVLSKGTCARNLLQRCKFSHQKETTWQHLLLNMEEDYNRPSRWNKCYCQHVIQAWLLFAEMVFCRPAFYSSQPETIIDKSSFFLIIVWQWREQFRGSQVVEWNTHQSHWQAFFSVIGFGFPYLPRFLTYFCSKSF